MSLKAELYRKFHRLSRHIYLVHEALDAIDREQAQAEYERMDAPQSVIHPLRGSGCVQRLVRVPVEDLEFSDPEHERRFWDLLEGRPAEPRRVFWMVHPRADRMLVIE